MRFTRFLSTLLLSAGIASAATDLVRNVSLEEKTDNGNGPADWGLGGPSRWTEDESGNHFIRITCDKPGEMNILYREFDIPAETSELVLSFRVRVTGLRTGSQPWFDARLIHKLRDASGDHDQPPDTFSRDTRGWEKREIHMPVPNGTTKYIFMPSLFQAQAGTLDLDDIRLTALKDGETIPSTLPKAKEPAPLPECPLAPLTEVDTPHVDGPLLKTSDGRELWLQGLAIPSLEWLASGEHIMESVAHAIADWKANVIRLPLKEKFWFGRAPEPHNRRTDGGEGYRKLVDEIVAYANERGCYVLLDLHDFKAPTEEHAEFWNDCAARYANCPGVMFDLFNEPHDISWNEWRNGGDLKEGGGADAVAENNEAQEVVRTIGMQALVDTVRATGAKNVLVCGGLDWAYDNSGILEGFALDDPNGNGIVYSVHVYPWKSNWQHAFLDVAAKHPLFLGEVGAQDKPMPFEKSLVDPYAWSPEILACIQKNKLHWTAWSFHPGASPCVISNWDYTPTPYWGAFVRAALRGARFESDRLR